ncbi:hypothetical protein [Gordonia sp. MP11Mi]|uniref:Uncharacterized protein n=1 Tax=Gordonia sp. MP11Mi TaxID=3022769 RepID=A0AA97CWK1_9ACTN
MEGHSQRQRDRLASEVSATATAIYGSPSLRLAILQTGVVIAVAVAIVLAVVAAPSSRTDRAVGSGTGSTAVSVRTAAGAAHGL